VRGKLVRLAITSIPDLGATCIQGWAVKRFSGLATTRISGAVTRITNEKGYTNSCLLQIPLEAASSKFENVNKVTQKYTVFVFSPMSVLCMKIKQESNI